MSRRGTQELVRRPSSEAALLDIDAVEDAIEDGLVTPVSNPMPTAVSIDGRPVYAQVFSMASEVGLDTAEPEVTSKFDPRNLVQSLGKLASREPHDPKAKKKKHRLRTAGAMLGLSYGVCFVASGMSMSPVEYEHGIVTSVKIAHNVGKVAMKVTGH